MTWWLIDFFCSKPVAYISDIDLLQITELQLQFFTNQIIEFFLLCLWQELGANPF